MAPREALGVHFGLFWALVAKWLPERPWELILAYSGLWRPNGSQRGPGSSFWLVLGSGGQKLPEAPRDTHKHSEAPINAKKHPEALRNTQEHSEASVGTQKQPETSRSIQKHVCSCVCLKE